MAGRLIFLLIVLFMITTVGCNSDQQAQENQLLRREADLAKKEAELAKKELELSKGSNSSNTNAEVLARSEPSKAVVPRRVKNPSDLRRFTENNDGDVLAVDLNSDGQDEYLSVIGMCGSGGCEMGVFEKTAHGFKNIFAGDDLLMPDPAPPPVSYWKPEYRFQAGPQSNNGYLDLVLVWKKGKSSRFRFDGTKYRAVK
jgi:hypothetical protein